MEKEAKIYIAGHRGLVGGAIKRRLESAGFTNIIGRTRSELNLLSQQAVQDFFTEEKPDYVFLAAAKVGGIQANNEFRGQFIYENLQIQNNIIHSAYEHGVKKLLFLGSTCIYPKLANQPLKEEYLLTGELEPTNQPYALAKIAGVEMCNAYNRQYGTNFIAAMPTNLYGPGDNFDLENSHVLPALIRKFHEAKQNDDPSVTMWGTGTPKREFLYVEDLADALVFLMENYAGDELVNVGVGEDIAIKELAELIKSTVGYEGEIVNDTTKPDGTPRKLVDVSKINSLGWKASTTLEDGVAKTYQWFLDHIDDYRAK